MWTDNCYKDNDFMTFAEFMTRLRKDLDAPNLHVSDIVTPDNEEKYQKYLVLFRDILAQQKIKAKLRKK